MTRHCQGRRHWHSQTNTAGSKSRTTRVDAAGLCIFIAVVLVVGLAPDRAAADGGTVQFSQVAGGYRITVMTDPTPLRVGSVDLSIMVQDAHIGQIVSDGRPIVSLRHTAEPPLLIHCEATTAAATNKLLRSAQVDLPRSGSWELHLELSGMAEPVRVQSTIAVANKPPRWRSAAGWIAAPFVVIGLYIGGELLAARRAVGSSRPATLSGAVE